MTNEKLTKLKRKVKQYAPEIIVGATVVAGVIALVWIKNQVSGIDEPHDLVLQNDIFERMNRTGESLELHHHELGNFLVSKLPD